MFPAVRDWSEAMMTALAGGMAMFFSAIPKGIAFAVIMAGGDGLRSSGPGASNVHLTRPVGSTAWSTPRLVF